jgi:hypothetical protein
MDNCLLIIALFFLSASVMLIASLSAEAIASDEGWTHQPQLRSVRTCQGVPVVVITGSPEESASAIDCPKFSKSLGAINKSAGHIQPSDYCRTCRQ